MCEMKEERELFDSIQLIASSSSSPLSYFFVEGLHNTKYNYYVSQSYHNIFIGAKLVVISCNFYWSIII